MVDEVVVSSRTLHGMFLGNKIKDITLFDKQIENDTRLQLNIICKDVPRAKGKTTMYKLGATIVYEHEYILTSFSKFDTEHRAYLYASDFFQFLSNLWEELNAVCGDEAHKVNIPLFGSGCTIFKDWYNVSEQKIIEEIIQSFEVFKRRTNSQIMLNIIIHTSKKDLLDFSKLAKLDIN